MTGLAFLGQIAVVEKRLMAAKKRMERYKADMDYVNRRSQTGKVSKTPDVTRNESMVMSIWLCVASLRPRKTLKLPSAIRK